MKLHQPILLMLTVLGTQLSAANTLTVMNLNDGGAGSLREALSSHAPGDTIVFDPGLSGFITLTNELSVGDVNIIGEPGKIGIRGNNTYRVFYVGGSSNVTIAGLTIADGRGGSYESTPAGEGNGGGGIYNDITLDGVLTVSNCSFIDNFVSNYYDDAGGGAIFNQARTMTVVGCLFWGNQVIASGHNNAGGAIYSVGSTLSVINSTFYANTVQNTGFGDTTGGAIFNDSIDNGPGDSRAGTCFIKSCTFQNNAVSNPQVSGSTGASIATGIHSPVALNYIQNTIIANNYFNGAELVFAYSQGFNWIGETLPGNNWQASDRLGTAASPLDPMLDGGPKDNGGPTLTIRPRPHSPVINAGNSGGLTTDQRGYSRPFDFPGIPIPAGGDGSDIGAVEWAPPGVSLALAGGNAFVFWSTNDTDYALETASALSPTLWKIVSGTPAIVGNQFVFTAGAPTNNQFFRLAQTISGTALSFDGAAAYVSIGAAPLTSPWTAEFWVNRQDAPNYSASLLGDASTALKLEQFNFTRRVGFTRFGVADYTFNYSAPTNTWVHLAFVSDTNTRLYVNGVLQDTVSATIALPLDRLGFDSSGHPDYMRGYLDEVRVWNVARTQAQIQAGMNHSLSAPQANLVGYWRFDEGNGTNAFDSSGQGKTGTLQNAPAWVSSTVPLVP